MTALVVVLIGLWLLAVSVTLLVIRGGSKARTPKPVPSKDQILWMTAAAKVAARRHA
jgi:hypothetical protein